MLACDTTDQVKSFWEAASCGTRRTGQAKHSQAYFDDIEAFRYTHEPFIHQFAQFTRWRGRQVLEVGTGAGTDFVQFLRAGAIAHGVDLTQESITNVQKRLELEGLEAADLRVANAEQLPYDDASFDLVYSWGVIHHAENPEKCLAEICRVAKSGGTVRLMIYNRNSLHACYMWLRHCLLRGQPHRSRRWAIFHHQESYATQAHTRREWRRIVRRHAPQDLRFTFWDQKIRRGAKFATARRIIQGLTPPSARWFMAVEFRKP